MTRISKLLVTEGNLNLIKTSKYKDINISIRCSFKYSRKLKASLSILAALMQEESKKYPSKVEMSRAKDMLYGLSFSCYVNCLSDVTYYTINYNFANPKFLKTANIEEYISFIDTTMNEPLFSEELFNEEKRNLIDRLKRKLDNPSSLALNLFYKEVAKDDARFESYDDNIVDELNSVSLSEIKQVFADLYNSRIDVYLVGDYDEKLAQYLRKYESKTDLHCSKNPLTLSHKEDITYKKAVGQSTLIVSYSSPFTKGDKDFYAFNIGSVLFGGTPASLLFSEVREKQSLCYSIYARSIKYEGLLYVLTNIEAKSKDKALKAIDEQFKHLLNKDYDLTLLEVAKSVFINNSYSIDDDLEYLIDYVFAGNISDSLIPIEEYIEGIRNVTVDDVARVFANVKDYLVYFLEGTKNE